VNQKGNGLYNPQRLKNQRNCKYFAEKRDNIFFRSFSQNTLGSFGTKIFGIQRKGA
jgi:hypothetical protein